ncbi:hypothetical protein HK097_000675, partial [Rhizophlyctis rosea]
SPGGGAPGGFGGQRGGGFGSGTPTLRRVATGDGNGVFGMGGGGGGGPTLRKSSSRDSAFGFGGFGNGLGIGGDGEREGLTLKPPTFVPKGESTGLEDIFNAAVKLQPQSGVSRSTRAYFNHRLVGYHVVAKRLLCVAGVFAVVERFQPLVDMIRAPVLLTAGYVILRGLAAQTAPSPPRRTAAFGVRVGPVERIVVSDGKWHAVRIPEILITLIILRMLVMVVEVSLAFLEPSHYVWGLWDVWELVVGWEKEVGWMGLALDGVLGIVGGLVWRPVVRRVSG